MVSVKTAGSRQPVTRAYPHSTYVKTAPDPSDRLFKSDEHEHSPPVSVGSSISSLPAALSEETLGISTEYGPGIRLRGREYLSNITVSTTATARGQCLYALPISPDIIPNTRLQIMSNMWTRYIFRKFRVTYAGTAPTTQPGSLMMYCDYDPSQNPFTVVGDVPLRYAYTHDATDVSVWEKATVEVTDAVYNEMLYVDPALDTRWSIQGTFWLLSSGALAAGLECGKLILDYEIDFAVPDLRGPIASATNLTALTVNIPVITAGNPLIFNATAPNGVYFVRIDGNPTTTVTYAPNLTDYQVGVAYYTLAQGMGFYGVVFGNTLALLMTPSFYQPNYQNDRIIAGAATTAGTFVVSLYGLTSPSVD